MAPPPRHRLHTRGSRLSSTAATLLLLLHGTAHAFLLPIPAPGQLAVSRSPSRPGSSCAAAPLLDAWGTSSRRQRLAWMPLRATDGDQEEEDEEETAAAARAAAIPITTTTSSASTCKNLTTTIPDLLGSRSLGLDWGHKKIGVGVSAGFSQRPLGTIPNVGKTSGNATLNRPTLDHILALVRAEQAVRVVMGNPLFRDGTLSPQANTTKCFARLLANRAVELGITRPWADEEGERGPPFVYLWDERLTSQAARVNIKTKAFLHSSSDVDSQAACLVLEDFYNARAYKAEVVWPDPGVLPIRETMPKAPEGEASNAAGGAVARVHMSYDEWRRAERERYEAGRVNLQQAAEEGAAKKKKKKKKNK